MSRPSEKISSPEETQDPLSTAISKELGWFLSSRSATFACGGSIHIDDSDEKEDSVTKAHKGTAQDQLSSPPITIRWDSNRSEETGDTQVDKIRFPITSCEYEKLEKIARDCQPATFGYKGEDVLDETYRKATKMDRSDFSTDFCPYELGIVDTITQILMPNEGARTSTKGVRAELYKLNIYSAPSGFFKAHVDTPRAETQFGSLVVSLPCRYEGGQLVVRHAGNDVSFDWSASKVNADAIHWAAFYSDCEHEVLQLTEGHRVTLTYNLYYAPGVGDLAGKSPAMDICNLPLYKKVQEALTNPSFMPNGGYLGVFCTHAYAHTTDHGSASLPGVLKGADMAVYVVFRALGLSVQARTLLDDREKQDEERWLYEDYEEEEEDDEGDEDGEYDEYTRPFDYIGHPGQLVTTSAGGYDSDRWDDVAENFEGDKFKVNWLTKWPERHNGDVGFVHLTYGNEAGISAVYTHAILLIDVPQASRRLKGSEAKQ